jgi:uncharacterized protein
MDQASIGVPLTFAGATLVARADGALWWPAESLLVVADLHLGKAERMARRGGALLPPWAEDETLARLGAALGATGAARVAVLGDGFDDAAAAGALRAEVRTRLAALAAGRAWLWIEGNHDAGLDPGALGLPGQAVASAEVAGIALHHEGGAEGPAISAHWHPAVRVAGRRRAAFLVGAAHLVLPAFGRFTGGLDAGHPALAALVPSGVAVLTGPRAVAVPWPIPG